MSDDLLKNHPLTYGFHGREVVYEPGDDLTVTDRLARCPNCEQWSPCDVRKRIESASDHPENVCNRCGGPNVSWCAPSPLWNYVMRGGTIDGDWQYGELICPMCFVALAQEKGIDVSWRVSPVAPIDLDLQTVLPDGREWNPKTWLWESRDQ